MRARARSLVLFTFLPCVYTLLQLLYFFLSSIDLLFVVVVPHTYLNETD